MLLDDKGLLVDAEENKSMFMEKNVKVYNSTMKIKRVQQYCGGSIKVKK